MGNEASNQGSNAEFSNPKMGQGFKAEGMTGKQPEEAITEQSHDTAPEKANNSLKEDKG